MKCGAGNVFDPFHHLDELVVKLGGDRGKTNAAVSHGHGRHTMM